MIPVKPDAHAWAFEDKDPKRFIAALELLGDVYYTQMAGEPTPDRQAHTWPRRIQTTIPTNTSSTDTTRANIRTRAYPCTW